MGANALKAKLKLTFSVMLFYHVVLFILASLLSIVILACQPFHSVNNLVMRI